MIRSVLLSAMIGFGGVGALAQPADGETGATTEAKAWVPNWTSPAIERAATMLSGVWKTSSQVAQSDGAGSTNIVMSIAPCPVGGLSDTLYVEAAREDALFEPYRQAIFQVYAYKSGLRLRTYEFRNTPGLKAALVGLSYAPDLIGPVAAGDLIATLDLDLTSTGDGFTGKTPYPYPTGAGGAVEMTSEITLNGSKLVSADRGIGANGSVVWGSQPGDTYEFAKSEAAVRVERTPEGVAWIVLKEGEGEAIQTGHLAVLHYTGFLDDGRSFDGSRMRPQPMTVRWPGQMIAGWNLGLAGIKVGERRRLVIPSVHAYGAQGRAGVIPPNARLTFEIECVGIRAPESPAVTAPETSGTAPSGH
jgi:hypothetical protein